MEHDPSFAPDQRQGAREQHVVFQVHVDVHRGFQLRQAVIQLMGDFNARPTAAEMIPIFARFVDAWTAGVPTPDNPNGHTSPSRLTGSPTSRIDYIFASPQVTVSSAYVPIDAGTRLAADHYPVVADIALPGSEVGIGAVVPGGR
ncbi:MAG: endonuclease/exonuclease/phosphatase family protein [Vicinamibacterales bacterium]